jgi:hypothetical protein
MKTFYSNEWAYGKYDMTTSLLSKVKPLVWIFDDVANRFLWESITPLGSPVVPDV